MGKYAWNTYQKNIFNTVGRLKHNLVINAYAGTGKTTTLIESLNNVPEDKTSIFLAFNRRIVSELKGKLPEGYPIKTFHQFGFELIKNHYTGNKVQVDDGKKYRHILKYMEREGVEDEKERKVLTEFLSKNVDLIRMYVAGDYETYQQIAQTYNIPLDGEKYNIAKHIVEEMSRDKFMVDYLDMVFIPNIRRLRNIPKYDVIFVDECQDLNIAQHGLLGLIKKRKTKTIAFGDKHQMIYTFAGASPESYQMFLNQDKVKVVDLPLCYRCGKNIVNKAQEIVPQIKSPDNQHDGKVTYHNNLPLDEITEGDWVLSRFNRDLSGLYVDLQKRGRKVKILGESFKTTVLSLAQDLDPKQGFRIQLIEKLDEYKEIKLELGYDGKDIDVDPVFDELKSAVSYITSMITENLTKNKLYYKLKKSLTPHKDDEEVITLSTIHKSKGIEADRIFLYRWTDNRTDAKWDWEIEQETNLSYVAMTRAKNELHIVNE